MEGDAEFSKDGVYRYSLCREWDKFKPYVLFIGFNPSKADKIKNDRTITKCIKYAKKWGYGGLRMANLFAYVSPKPEELQEEKVSNPIGIDNDRHINDRRIKELYEGAGITVVAWGNLLEDNLPSYKYRYKEVLKLIKEPMCLTIRKSGQPAHLLYLSMNLNPQPYNLTQQSNGNI